MGKGMKMILKPDSGADREVGNKVVGFRAGAAGWNQALKRAGGSLFPRGSSKSCIINV